MNTPDRVPAAAPGPLASPLSAATLRASLLVPLFVCLLLNVASLALIAAYHPNYLRDYRTNPNPDAPDYVLLGRNLLLHGAYSRNEVPPFTPDIFRTPAYPVFAGGLDILGGAWLIYVVQVGLHLGICVVVYRLGERAWGERPGFLASLVVAIHPTLLSLTVQAMSELLFLFLLLISVLWLARGFQATGVRLWTFFFSGLVLGLAILTRPAGLYLPMLIAGFVMVASYRLVGGRRALERVVVFLLGLGLLVAPWVARNALVFGYPVLTTNDTVVLVYFTGAGAYQVHHGVEWDRAVQMIADEHKLSRPEEMWNYSRRGGDAVEMDRAARRVIWPVLIRYPADLARSCLLGLIKSLFSHDGGSWAKILGIRWTAPGSGGLARLDGAAWGRLAENHPVLIAGLAWQIFTNVVLILGTMVGVWRVLRGGNSVGYLILVLLLFFMAVCAASGIDAFTRFSAAFLPFAAMIAATIAGKKS